MKKTLKDILKEKYNDFLCPNQVALDRAMDRLNKTLDDIIDQHRKDMERLNREVKEFPTKTNRSGY